MTGWPEWHPDSEDMAHLPDVLIASQLAEDELIRARAERLIQRAAALAVGYTVEPADQSETFSGPESAMFANLMEALQAARAGDATALQAVETNVRTDMVERTIKAGHVMTPVELRTDANGKIWQFGQSMDDVHMNALRYTADDPRTRSRTEAEARNGARIEHHDRAGRLDEYYFAVISRCADGMDDTALADAGFFTDTKSCAIQFTYRDGDVLKTESAFVAGVRERGGGRHDADTVAAMGREMGVDLQGMSDSQLLDTPLLIHKSRMPSGVTDMVALYDACAGGTFFGQSVPPQDYAGYKAACRQREDSMGPSVAKVVEALLNEAPAIMSPEQAVERLHALSEREMLDVAILDARIDPRVFGAVAAAHIEAARYHRSQGNYSLLAEARQNAQETARSSSCPMAARAKAAADSDRKPGESEEHAGKKRMNCPFCGDHVYADPCAPVLSCGSCLAVAGGGKIRSEGNGGRRRREAEKARQESEATREYLKKLWTAASRGEGTATTAVKTA